MLLSLQQVRYKNGICTESKTYCSRLGKQLSVVASSKEQKNLQLQCLDVLYYLRDSMLACYMLWPYACQVKSSVETGIELVFGLEVYLGLSYIALAAALGVSKNNGTFLRNFVPNSEVGRLFYFVDCIKCRQLNPTIDHRQFTTLNTHLRLQHDGHEASASYMFVMWQLRLVNNIDDDDDDINVPIML